MASLQRTWRGINSSPKAMLDTKCFSLCTWNMLADRLGESGGFTNISASELTAALRWEARFDRVIDVVTRDNYDIICMQVLFPCIGHWSWRRNGASLRKEVDKYDALKTVLSKNGYESIFLKKIHDVGDGVCVFWKAEKFSLKETVKLKYQGQRGQVALLLALGWIKKKDSGVILSTTHLKAKSSFEEVRLEQGIELVQAVSDMQNRFPSYSPLICGDFNDTPTSPVCLMMKEGEKGGEDGGFVSSYPEDLCPWTTWKKRDTVIKRTIDYIWYKPNSGIKVCEVLELPKDEDCPDMLPALYFPSDHMSLAAKFCFE